jgi:hypothetical protein
MVHSNRLYGTVARSIVLTNALQFCIIYSFFCKIDYGSSINLFNKLHTVYGPCDVGSWLRMKTERKYPEPTVFVFYIMIPFLNIKNCQFQLVSQPFSTIFLYSLIAKM